ncbi:MAG: all-trans-retinol 13,14-reductase, partial [Cytophagales bacterium]|nr:all-trans-retinol 13,14-reductase [Cytophagales bacterium]
EKQNLERYVGTLQKVCADFPLYNLRKGAEEIDSPYISQSLKDFIESITPNKKLQNILIGNNMLYAGDPAKTPLHVHALVTNSYIQSAWRCVGGGSQIANELGKMIQAHGGKLKKRSQVVKIESEGERVTHVVLNSGEKIEGDIFISNTHPVATFDMLVAKSIRPAFRQRLAQMENSISTFIVNIVLEPGKVPYFNHNFYIHTTDDLWGNLDHTDDNWPKSFAIFCAESNKNTGFCESITLMAYMRYDEVAKWNQTFNTAELPSERGEAYENFKSKKTEVLIGLLEKRIPGIRMNIKASYSATPLTYRDYIGTLDGSIYGITKDFRDPLKTFISPRTKLSNLFLTGQNVHMHGVLGVTVSSLLTCSQILGHDYLMDKLLVKN